MGERVYLVSSSGGPHHHHQSLQSLLTMPKWKRRVGVPLSLEEKGKGEASELAAKSTTAARG